MGPSVFANLPNDIILKILHENKINKQTERNKSLFSSVLSEMKQEAGHYRIDRDTHEPIDFIEVYDEPFELLFHLRELREYRIERRREFLSHYRDFREPPVWIEDSTDDED